jgi:putative transposase
MQLSVVKKKTYKRKNGHQSRKMTAIKPNSIWAFDFVHDECANGQKLKCFAVKDEYTRESLAIDVGARFRSCSVLETLDRLVCLYGQPGFLRCDNGPEFIANAVKFWARRNEIEIAYTDPGKPWQNGSIESFNGRFRDECLDMEWFANRREARVLIEAWRQDYNLRRPHSAIGYKTPSEVRSSWQKKINMAENVAA